MELESRRGHWDSRDHIIPRHAWLVLALDLLPAQITLQKLTRLTFPSSEKTTTVFILVKIDWQLDDVCEVCHDMAVSVSSLAGCVQLQCNYSLLATEESSQCPQLRPDQGHLSLVINLSSSLKYLDTYLLSTFH